MGRERTRAGQHVYLCLASLTAVVLAGCAAGYSLQASGRWEHLRPVRERIETRDFDAAVRDYDSLMAGRSGRKHPDLVLFDLGLLHAHYANPGKDYKKAAGYFSQLVREHPASLLAEEARIWVDLLRTMERANRVDIDLDERRRD